MTEDVNLPLGSVKRIVKAKLAELAAADGQKDYQLNKDALLAFTESAKVFISFISCTANDICKEHKRQTISVDDVFQALDDMDFPEFLSPLREALQGTTVRGSPHRHLCIEHILAVGWIDCSAFHLNTTFTAACSAHQITSCITAAAAAAAMPGRV